jgi:phasin family protein
MTEAMTATAKGKFDRAMAACQALSQVKSPKEAMDIQTSFARASFEEAVADTQKFVDSTTKLGREVMAPMTERLTQAEHKLTV